MVNRTGFRRVFRCDVAVRNVCAELSGESSPIAAADSGREFFAPDHTWDGVHPDAGGELRAAAAFADVFALRFGSADRAARKRPRRNRPSSATPRGAAFRRPPGARSSRASRYQGT
jgi:hypothetical protein